MASLSDVFHNGKQMKKKPHDVANLYGDKIAPKFVIGNPEAFAKNREILGNIIVKNMKASGGMDVDWLIERKGNFIILEIKSFYDDRIRIPLGQIIAYKSLHEQLNKNGKCYLYVIGVDENDFTDDNGKVWLFEMKEWADQKIPHISQNFEENDLPKDGFVVERSFMHELTVHEFRDLVESAWKEFG
jgi:hypothetical protein